MRQSIKYVSIIFHFACLGDVECSSSNCVYPCECKNEMECCCGAEYNVVRLYDNNVIETLSSNETNATSFNIVNGTSVVATRKSGKYKHIYLELNKLGSR